MKLKSQEETTRNKREFSRVEALLPFGSRIITPQEMDISRAKLFGEAIYSELSTLPEIGDAHLSVWLKTINAKLDAVMRMIALYQGGFQSLPLKAVTISANGMHYLFESDIPVGTTLEIKVILFSLPPVAVQLYGEVLSSTKHNDQYRIALKFMEMDEHIRNEIVRFVFEKEREILRAKRGEMD
ncbi:MAG: PilZ domain-containing protein [Syntrophaceae bacterium]|nr:PilZ domain-containing protein [Syntrophaceae bacterium]